MSLLKAYLQNPRTRRALNRKPGEKGFSLIELVVVVAVLAILAAIAVPAYMGMQEQAADSALDTNLKNAYKECAYQIARGQNNRGLNYPNFALMGDDGYVAYTSNAATKTTSSHSCYSTGTTKTTLTGTKTNYASGKANGAHAIDVLTGAITFTAP